MPASRPYGFLLGPKWIAFHLLVLTAVVVMVNLAFWQLRRLDERKEFNSTVRDHSNQPVAPMGDVLTPGADPAALEWRRVEVDGTYLGGKQVLVVNRSQDNEAGRNVVDPLQLADGTIVLVNRGFVGGLDPVPPAPAGPVHLVGKLRASEVRRLGQPEDASGVVLTEVRRLDIAKLAPQMGGTVAPMYLELLESTPADTGVQPVTPPTLDEGPHLSYTIQWFIFSICAIAGWVLAVRRSTATRAGNGRRPKRRGPPPIADELSRV